ncbi:MAG TPA: dihydrolipoyl dehydrogenase [Xanthomonadales bacterium]|nr:dihydrolipoyl dehydrogenase [Xanthomonadales bacterium]
MARIEIKVPDIGSYKDIPVIELLVKPGDSIRKDQGLLTLESDKATMEVPSSDAGTVVELRVKVGDAVSEGMVVAVLEVADVGAGIGNRESGMGTAAPAVSGPGKATASAAPALTPVAASAPARTDSPFPIPDSPKADSPKTDLNCQLLVLGAGPGGYTAAFRGADLDLDVILVERYAALGGVCLNVGCIPSKALLHAARVIDEAAHAADIGISFGAPQIDLDKLRGFKTKVVGKLTGGLAGMAKQRKVRVVQGDGQFSSSHTLTVQTADGPKVIGFEHAIIAVGSQAVKLPGLPWGDPRLMDSTDALELAQTPKKLLVIGGGIIGLEMACVYDALGSEVTVVELFDQLMPGCDPDLVRPLAQRLSKRYSGIYLKTKVAAVTAQADGLLATFEGDKAPPPTLFDRVLCAVGRSPNGKKIGAENAGVNVSERGFISVDKQMRTNVGHIFAIGDVVGQPMLAHKATHEGKVAAEVAAGHKSEFVARVIPSVAYTDPEIAWVGVTEGEAKAQGLNIGVGKFPHAASGRAIGMDRTEGFTKLIFDNDSHKIIGAGIVGPSAGDLIAETALAIEMGCDAADIGLTIHPHPTLSESVGMAAEVFEGTITDLYIPKKKA